MKLILSAAAGYNWQQLEIFVKSLRKNYSGKVLLILNNPNIELINKLKNFDIDYLDTKIVPSDSAQSRYKYYYDYLNDNKVYEQVLLTDSRDVLFQNNPFNFFYKKDLNFFLEDEYIKNSSINSEWIEKTTGKLSLENIKDKKISCCGQVIGRHQSILNYCHIMRKNIITHKYKPSIRSFLFQKKMTGWDQGIHNYLVYSDIFNNVDFYDNKNGDVATLALHKGLNFNNRGRLINQNGNEYSVIHQYDRFIDLFKSLVYKICN
jgi:hypothetical protein